MSQLWLLTVTALLGCSDPAPAPTATPTSTPAPPPSVREPSNPTDAAYVGVKGGLVLVDHGKATTLLKHDYPIQDIVIDERGVVYATAIGGTWQIDKGKVTDLPGATPHAYYDRLAVGPDGVLWTLDREGAHRWERKAWTSFPTSTFGNKRPQDIAVDRAGGAWAITSDNLWRFDGTSWTQVDKKFTGTKEPSFDTVVAAASGEVYVISFDDVFVNDKDVWRKLPMIPRGSYLTLDEMAIGADGRVAASGGVGDVVIRAAGGEPRQVSLKKLGAKAREAKVEAVDGAGRTWIRTDNGVVILDAEGKLLQQWMPGTVDGIVGTVETIAIVGNGPTLPTLVSAARGVVVGKVVSKGKPVGNAAVEICPGPASIALFEKTPCTGSPVVRTGVTAVDGTFKIADVPVGSYGFAVKPKRTWFVESWGSERCCTSLENGQVYDIGAITLDKLE